MLDGVWVRPGLSGRDRGLITVAALIARQQVVAMRSTMGLALDEGLAPRDRSPVTVTALVAAEAMAHLVFHVGWTDVFSAMPVMRDLFEKRVGASQ